MKKYIAMTLAVLMILGLAGCNNSSNDNNIENQPSVSETITVTDPETVTETHDSETQDTETHYTYAQISMDEAVAMMETKTDYIILDVRTPEEFAEKHIPDAINIPNETIGDDSIPELPDEDQLILVYCRSGNRSKQASEKLVELGYTNVYEFGGINDWTGETVSELME